MKHLITVCLCLGGAALASPSPAQTEQPQTFYCTTEFGGHQYKGYRPKWVVFQIVPGASKVIANDPMTLAQSLTVKANQRVQDDGKIALRWRLSVPTTLGYSMGGTIRVKFDPVSRSGTIQSSIPSRLVDGGRQDGTVACEITDRSKVLNR